MVPVKKGLKMQDHPPKNNSFLAGFKLSHI